uniref:NADH-ubiquinone oxidoreductase chain 4 n=1 Tax=Pristurus rupestris rupestris TaxID=1530261 RepID=A0A343SA25_9SAUR|nr:NADH dehydrogenase subunit 4 [Pristurus rupestris rupestris]
MLKLLLATLMLAPTSLVLPPATIFSTTTAYSMIIALLMTSWITSPMDSPQQLNTWLMLDTISAPLLILSAWLLPLMILASQHHLAHEPTPRQRLFLSTCALLQTTLITTFLANNLMLFFIAFEATLIPTMILITRWGAQPERLLAGSHLLFYTLMGSLPLLVMILHLFSHANHTMMLLLHLTQSPLTPSPATMMMWLACFIAFLIKLPLYSTHLWLPKAHVEAPIAGSMILAAVLLKLGGYGIIRTSPLFTPTMQYMYYPFITLSLWGIIMTSLACLRLTDLKAIIAYSSIGHMGLVASATLIQTPWSITGAMFLMIAHGLTSSMLFCLANTVYERTHTRTLLLLYGLQQSMPLMTMWWFTAGLMNMALPPSINLIGELTVICSLYSWMSTTAFFTAPATIITALYTLYIFLTTQWHKAPTICHNPTTHTREHLLMFLHLTPLILLALNPCTTYN